MLCLTQRTPEQWTRSALANLDAVLVDHAHCEMKAATNALSLAVRASEVPGVASALIALAEEELAHFRRVFEELERRGIPLGTPPPDAYAAELRKIVRAHTFPTRGAAAPERIEALVDRLLVAALIEARSCERFRLLADALAEAGPADLCALYRELLAAEARHYRTFVELARRVAGAESGWVEARFGELVELEAELASRLGSFPAIHG